MHWVSLLLLLALLGTPATHNWTDQRGRASPAVEPNVQDLHDRVYQKVQDWIDRDQLARPDGYTYAVDIGQLLTYMALRGDNIHYAKLRDFSVQRFLLDNPSDPYTRGFVLWRYKEAATPDASGTTEALRIAQGLWLGSQRFGDQTDGNRALMVLRGYAAHEYVDQGVWLIRNYFNLGTRAFATNSYLADYDPDFVREVATARGDLQLKDISSKSYMLARQAVAPSGLLHQIIQPEVLTLFPGLGVTVFSPNDIVQLLNTCTVAERVVAETPEVGQGLLSFALQRRSQLKLYYLGRSGEPIAETNPGVETYACLVRLAAKLKQEEARTAFLVAFLQKAEEWVQDSAEPRLYKASELLLAFQAIAPTSTTTTLASSANPSTYGQAVTFTATAASPAGTPTGSVTFQDSSSSLGSVVLSAGMATYTTASLSVGSHSIAAQYGGDSGFAASASEVLTQTVTAATGTQMLLPLISKAFGGSW